MREVNLRGLDLNLLVLLDALIEHRSVTQAAAAANMSQPAMSRALGRLRALLGDPILARGSDGYRPTPRALALHPVLRGVLAEIQGIVLPQTFDPATWRGQVTLAATDHQTIMLLPGLMARLSRQAPRLDLKVVPFLAAMVDELRDGRIDLAFGIAEQELGSGLRQEALYRDAFVTLLRHGHAAAQDWTLERFAGLDHVLVTVLGDGRGVLDEELARLGRERRIALRLPHFYAAIEVVARSDLVVTLPRSMALRFRDRFELLVLEPPIARPPFTVTAIWPEVLDADPGVTWLRSVIRDEASRIEGVMSL
ncbi:MAG TPA: LysR family transcriptional regulator [Beijerinckiaceae bacterium]|jgi:DNA-binding transcriptional LysR family regulator